MLNRIILIGRLTRDPEVRTVGEHPVANFSLAVDRPFCRLTHILCTVRNNNLAKSTRTPG